MPRLPRIHIDEGLYFITSHGEHARELFKDNTDRFEYLDLVGRYKVQYRFKVFAYVLMATFVHLLIEIGRGATLSDIMHDINSSYTKYYNGRYNRRGHLFRGRYRATIVEKERHLLDLTRYIHRVAQDMDEWSSLPAYKTAEKAGIVDAREVLRSFSQDDIEARRLYIEFVGKARKDELDALEERLTKGRFLGSKEFVEGIKKKAEAKKAKRQELRREELARMRKRIFAVAMIFVLAISAGGYIYFARKARLRELDARRKYQQEMDAYYKRLSRTLAIERQKARELEKRLLGEGE